jgi:hypothetical protein
MNLPTVLTFGAVVLLGAAVPFVATGEWRRPSDESLPHWMGTSPGRRHRFPIVAATLFAAVGGLASLANLIAK